MNRFIFLDIETTELLDDNLGPRSLILSVAVTYDNDRGYIYWLEDDVSTLEDGESKLILYLMSFDVIIGFNLIDFDYEVLAGYQPDDLSTLYNKTYDILQNIDNEIGHKISLNDLAECTLGVSKVGDGKKAVEYYKLGKLDKLINYCKVDVELTILLFEQIVLHGRLKYFEYGDVESIEIEPPDIQYFNKGTLKILKQSIKEYFTLLKSQRKIFMSHIEPLKSRIEEFLNLSNYLEIQQELDVDEEYQEKKKWVEVFLEALLMGENLTFGQFEHLEAGVNMVLDQINTDQIICSNAFNFSKIDNILDRQDNPGVSDNDDLPF